MKALMRIWVGVLFGFGVLGLSQALAESRPPFCEVFHDHRSHQADYYSYYPADDFYRAGPYGDNNGRDRDRGYSDNSYDGRGYGYANGNGYGQSYGGSRVVFRDVVRTRVRADILIVEEVQYRRRGERRVCTVTARGPEAGYVPYDLKRSVAYRRCSRYAEIRIY